ncbi:putative Carbonic anhydrase 7 [Hypsibius exemplaris]|uniref:Carbonic anhydrase n=1 Tax=Hypsibius exemplaris TaxID=2072580 RepID=A0A1W0WUK9_HYPEX|nr:putative Carbonic anhydrase 7 [Hypsibius exemplaris]
MWNYGSVCANGLLLLSLLSISGYHTAEIPWELNDGHPSTTDAAESGSFFERSSDSELKPWSYMYGQMVGVGANGPQYAIGPSEWHTAYEACGGQRQSPIHIEPAHFQANTGSPALKPLTFVDYDDAALNDTWTFLNNGHSVQITASFITIPQLQGGDLPGKYIFKQAHLHWGSHDLVGSEHVINGRRYPVEIHLVHQKKTLPDATAANFSDGLAVVGVLGELSAETHPLFDSIIHALELITSPSTTASVPLPGFTLSDLVPRNHSYVRYLGSLTTPPCSEAVIWSVLPNTLPISQNQLNALRRLWSKTKRSAKNNANAAVVLEDNFRPLQPLHGRTPQYFYDATEAQI